MDKGKSDDAFSLTASVPGLDQLGGFRMLDVESGVPPQSHSLPARLPAPSSWAHGFPSLIPPLCLAINKLWFVEVKNKVSAPRTAPTQAAIGARRDQLWAGKKKPYGESGQERLPSDSELAGCLGNGFYQLEGKGEEGEVDFLFCLESLFGRQEFFFFYLDVS